MTESTTDYLEVPGAVLAYDVHESRSPGARRPLFIFGSPMGADGFADLVPHFGDRTVITYDPRVGGRSRMREGAALSYEVHADDLHRVVEATGLGPVDAFASSGGAVAVLAWLLAHPDEVGTVVAHEPPLTALLDDGATAEQAMAEIAELYQRSGYGPAMARFVQLLMYDGPLPSDFGELPGPDPTQFGFPATDDGNRDDALLGGNLRMPPYRPDGDALRACGVRIVPAVGATSGASLAHRGGEALGVLLGVPVVEFPGDHGGFLTNEWSPDNDPAAFAARLREVLDGG